MSARVARASGLVLAVGAVVLGPALFAGKWLGSSVIGGVAHAETVGIWQRARPSVRAELALGAALDRVLEGYGDERDLLRAHTALVELGQGRAPARADHLVLLVHFRLELSFRGPERGAGLGERWATWLHVALARAELSTELRALAELELARLARAEGVSAREPLARALAAALDERRRSSIQVLQGVEVLADSGGASAAVLEAEVAFAEARSSPAGARWRAAGWIGGALVALSRGDEREARQRLLAGWAEYSSITTESGLSWPVQLSLDGFEGSYFEALLAAGRALTTEAARGEQLEGEQQEGEPVETELAPEWEPVCQLVAGLPPLGTKRQQAYGAAQRWLERSCRPPQTARPRGAPAPAPSERR
ncbi:MAG TPA: hypothetical protein VLC09_18195 [Polyangiaceae bacterium]|nr:hypothetical protein [Polyangiaceae bacterium]